MGTNRGKSLCETFIYEELRMILYIIILCILELHLLHRFASVQTIVEDNSIEVLKAKRTNNDKNETLHERKFVIVVYGGEADNLYRKTQTILYVLCVHAIGI